MYYADHSGIAFYVKRGHCSWTVEVQVLLILWADASLPGYLGFVVSRYVGRVLPKGPVTFVLG